MRVLHTADWHLGKTLEGRDRSVEQEQFLLELCELCEREAVDLVLMAGDVFQSYNPTAAAEDLFYAAIDRLSAHGERALIFIAGNHDSPERLCAASPLAERLGITLIGLPKDEILPTKQNGDRGVRRIAAGPSWVELFIPGQACSAVVAALPYPSEARLQELLTTGTDESALLQGYNVRLAHIFSQLSGHFRSDTVNLVMSHLYVRGGIESDSEQQIQVGGTYAVDPDVFPAQAQYVGLGHLHRPQWVKGQPMPIRYAGSPLAYSFSEAGYAKSVTLLDVTQNAAPQVEEIFLTAGRPLVRWRATGGLQEVARYIAEGRDPDAWIDLEVHVTEALTTEDIHSLRSMHKGFIHIRPQFPALERQMSPSELRELPADQLFIRFFERQTGGATPDEGLVRLFLELLNEEAEWTEQEGEGDAL